MTEGRGLKAWRLLGSLFSRAAGGSRLMGKTFGDNRDLWPTLGYRESPDVETYLSFYERGDIAAQIIDLPVTSTWRFAPEPRLDDATDEGQAWLDALDAFDDRTRMYAKMGEADRLTGIGRFGILFIGFRMQSTEELKEPVESINGLEDVLFFRAYHEGNVTITKWTTDEASPRFGMPELYQIDIRAGDGQGTGSSGGSRTVQVHWTRVIHIAEATVEDETFGTPRLERVVNKLDDLNKLVGSAAEIFWLAIAGILHADLSPDLDVDQDDMEEFETDIIEAAHGMRRLIQTRGVTLNRIAAEGNVDPGPTYDAITQLIAATARIPQRVLFGSERGELASSQDQRQWHATIKSRQQNQAEPIIVRALFDRLEMLGAFTQPEGWVLFWPSLDESTQLELAEIAELKAKAAIAFSPGGQAELLVKPWEAREILGLPALPEEAPEGAIEAFGEGLDVFGDPNDEPPLTLPNPDDLLALP